MPAPPKWIHRPAPRPDARVRLLCVPYAGGGASAFRQWPSCLPEWVEVCALQPPGREWRITEPPFTDIRELVTAAGEHVSGLLDRPLALYGHSLGACVAFELARHLEADSSATVALFVSGLAAPGVPRPGPPLEGMSDSKFVDEIDRRYGGIPEVILREPEILEVFLPTLRADVAALERYVRGEVSPLGCPIVAFGGSADPTVDESGLDAWRNETRGAFRVEMLTGGHFFIDSDRERLTEIIATTLLGVLAGGGEDRRTP